MEVEITFWRTRDGEEVDFLVERRRRITPVEVKMGTPNPRLLPRLEKLRESHWQQGRVVSLTGLDSLVGGGALSEDWRIVSPLDLEFLEMG